MLDILKDMMRGRHSAVTDPSLKVRTEGGVMYIFYTAKSGMLIYDISNPNGQVMLKGELNAEQAENTIDVTSLRKGNYTLYLIDGSDLVKYPFIHYPE